MTTDELLVRARQFATVHPKARFAFLRTWSSPHFYPLLIGLENRCSLHSPTALAELGSGGLF